MKKQLASSLLALSISTPIWAEQENPVKARELAKNLTFAEAKIIIELTNKAGSEVEKAELTRKLQRISGK